MDGRAATEVVVATWGRFPVAIPVAIPVATFLKYQAPYNTRLM